MGQTQQHNCAVLIEHAIHISAQQGMQATIRGRTKRGCGPERSDTGLARRQGCSRSWESCLKSDYLHVADASGKECSMSARQYPKCSSSKQLPYCASHSKL